ncbi:MAG TPA: hypothetical protein VH559_01320 [Gemmatimonadaceae bacterium]
MVERRRGISGLVGGTIAYWVVVAALKLGPAAFAIYRATRGPKGSSSVNLSFGDGRFTLNVIERGATTYTGTARLLAIAAWVALPPLIAWIAWAILQKGSSGARARRNAAGADGTTGTTERREQRNDGNPD